MSKAKTTKKQVIEVSSYFIAGLRRRLIKPTSFDRLEERASQRQEINQKETSSSRIK
jgi:hypothetical protein